MADSPLFGELSAWFSSLSPEFALLVALPFLVALAGIVRTSFLDDTAKRTTEDGIPARGQGREQRQSG